MFTKRNMYGIYLDTDTWLNVMQALFKDRDNIGIAEYIGDELGLLISIHPRSFEPICSCKTCMHRDECNIQTAPPICEHYMNYKIKEDSGNDD